ncbi:MAG TPA: hypothetical protein PK177_16930 [Burkholderiaceae bacterium]|nr:hypothetical protein [Burkholderiaceae bacterium]
MKAWLENLVGPDYATALLWTVVALIVLLVLLVDPPADAPQAAEPQPDPRRRGRRG